ncbi:hypothetical protein ACQPU1_05300 [Clostridium paraputrificum]|uniref:hypothetical protein n=1 Tax=Clostridium paraputrificum TaxID=29363 RepID=UPI003D32B7DF
MNTIALVLYFIGLLGVCSALLILGFKLHKKGKILNIITLTLIILSFISLGIGIILNLLNIKNLPSVDDIQSNTTVISDLDASEKVIDTYKDLSFIYKITYSDSSSVADAFLTVINDSSYLFSGNINLQFLDENNEILSTMVLPVKNLVPNSSINSNVQVNKNTKNIEYSFEGKFIKENTLDSTVDYRVKTMGIGDGYMRFEVVSKNKSYGDLEKICQEFKILYTSDICKGFLIYFIESDDLDFNKSYSDFFGDNEKNIYTLNIFENNTKYKIS